MSMLTTQPPHVIGLPFFRSGPYMMGHPPTHLTHSKTCGKLALNGSNKQGAQSCFASCSGISMGQKKNNGICMYICADNSWVGANRVHTGFAWFAFLPPTTIVHKRQQDNQSRNAGYALQVRTELQFVLARCQCHS